MSIEEYKATISEIEKRAEKEKIILARKYALENNTVKVGDVIKTPANIFKVVKIEVGRLSYSGMPLCIYCCEVIKKDFNESLSKKHSKLLF